MAQINLNITTKEGLVEKSAFLQSAETAYDQYVAERETEQTTIADAVKSAFDRFPGAGINMPALAHMALQTLNALPSNYKTLEKRVLDYVRENASDDRAAGKMFKIGKGVKGGVKRWSEIPVEAAPAAPAADATPAA